MKQQWLPPTPEEEALQQPDYTPWDAIRMLFDPQSIAQRGFTKGIGKTASIVSKRMSKYNWKAGGRTDTFGQPGDIIAFLGGRKNPKAVVTWDNLDDGTEVYQAITKEGYAIPRKVGNKLYDWYEKYDDAVKAVEQFMESLSERAIK